MLVQVQQGCLQQTVLRTVRIESIVFYEAALPMGMVELDLLREFHFAFEECCVFLNGFIATFQASFYNEEHFINKHPDKHFKDVHFLDIDTGSLQTLVRRIPKRFQHLDEQSLGFGSGSIIFNRGEYLGQNLNSSAIAQRDDADIVLLGYDTELDYKKIRKVCDLLDAGAEYYATNIDMVCPIENGRYLPDCGSFADMFENATSRRPQFLGKPDRTMIDILQKETNVPYENIAMVGDRIYTDVKTGVNAGVTSILVMSGETDEEILKNSDVEPTYIFDSVKNILEEIK